MENAKALPRKRFFIEMFTRDISLNDCILDLIDNSIDGYFRQNETLFSEIYNEKMNSKGEKLPQIKIDFDEKSIKIFDTCGGISYDYAKEEVFNFGHEYNHYESGDSVRLGVYGIGLKRAIFKMGNYFKIASSTLDSGFITEIISLDEWSKKDDSLDDWMFPIQKYAKREGATLIEVKDLRKETSGAIRDKLFEKFLYDDVARVYTLFLERYVEIIINGKSVKPLPIMFSESEDIVTATKEITIDNVKIKLYAGLAERDEINPWTAEKAGWYIACNGRIVVSANKDETTGWGVGALPLFHSKQRGFIGLVTFTSINPWLLPWTTTKRNLNKESIVFQKTRVEMQTIARPIISFLDKMYQKESQEENIDRKIVMNVTAVDIRSISNREDKKFEVKISTLQKKSTTTIQFSVEKKDIDKIKKYLNDPRLSNGQIGKITFDEYLKRVKI
jgi:hypothetical protein